MLVHEVILILDFNVYTYLILAASLFGFLSRILDCIYLVTQYSLSVGQYKTREIFLCLMK